ncbi:unnamed protein product [Hermetia illucens]|uniref:RING-type domain-containing protein n=1 Tax=Hermetia illucens TaxID=343691 RepID=A0A7R8UY40_HERIL|nr:RING finger protein vilya-like [Hermetia illucens]CAD7089188.1 unnamed protein product [Hermetia illucens]
MASNPLSWVHCNRCFTFLLQKTQKLYLLSCQHIICEPCIEQDEVSNSSRCPLCKIDVKSQLLGGQMPESCKILFHNKPLSDKKNWMNIIQFQVKHRKHLSRAIALTDSKLHEAKAKLADLKSDLRVVIKKRDEYKKKRIALEKHLQRFKEEHRKRNESSFAESGYGGSVLSRH